MDYNNLQQLFIQCLYNVIRVKIDIIVTRNLLLLYKQKWNCKN